MAWASFSGPCHEGLLQRSRDASGGTEKERARILEWHAASHASYEGFGADLIDATQPVGKVVDDLLDACSRRLAPGHGSSCIG